MRNKTVLEDLDAKISLILERYNYLKSENMRLKEDNSKILMELTSAKELITLKTEELSRLKEDEELKDLELEDIALRISQVLGISQEEEKAVA